MKIHNESVYFFSLPSSKVQATYAVENSHKKYTMRVCIFLENWMHFATLQLCKYHCFFSINYLLMANWWKFMSKKQIYQKKSLSLQGNVFYRKK